VGRGAIVSGDGAVTGRWETVGWCGLRLSVPGDWHPAGMDRGHLAFEGDTGAVMALKWVPSRGRGPLGGRLARIRRGFPREVRRTLRETVLPRSWREALAGNFEPADLTDAAAFRWSDLVGGGEGLVIRGGRSGRDRRVFLLLFHGGGASPGADIPKILSSFKSGARQGRVLWAVFDIQAWVPEAFRLVRHRFVPGAFGLTLAARRETLRLHRWGPASVLLRNRSLGAFAADRFGISRQGLSEDPNGPAVEWIDRPAAHGGLRRLSSLFSSMRRGRAWHVAGCDKILAVQVEAGRLPDEDRFMALCAAFHCLPPAGPRPGAALDGQLPEGPTDPKQGLKPWKDE